MNTLKSAVYLCSAFLISIPLFAQTPSFATRTKTAGQTEVLANYANNDWIATQWCTTPGVLDQSCIQNAINDITTNGPTQVVNGQTFRVGRIYAPEGTYNWAANATVTIPANTQVQIEGWEESNWGTVFSQSHTQSGDHPLFLVLANSFGLSHVFLRDTTDTNIAVELGTQAGTVVFDSRIQFNWFQGFQQGITMRNYSGGDFSHNTFEVGSWGITSNHNNGDIQANDLLMADERMYHETIGIYIIGDDTYRFRNISIQGGIYDYALGDPTNNAGIQIQHANNVTINGSQFDSNQSLDIALGAVNSANITSTSHYNTGTTPIYLNATTAATVSNINIHNCNTSNAAETSGVMVITANRTLINNVNGLTDSGVESRCNYAVSVNNTSVNSFVTNITADIHSIALTNILDPISQFFSVNGVNIFQQVGEFTTTAATSDSFTSASPGALPSLSTLPVGAHCYIQAANSTAASMTGVYVPQFTTFGTLTVIHPPIAGAVFSVACSSN